jgi:hypothetical protein
MRDNLFEMMFRDDIGDGVRDDGRPRGVVQTGDHL